MKKIFSFYAYVQDIENINIVSVICVPSNSYSSRVKITSIYIANNQNFQKPVEVLEKALHSPEVAVCFGISSNKVDEPYFFEDADTSHVRTVTIEAYIEMVENVVTADIHPDIWFQQDGATSHIFSLWGYVKERVFKTKPDTIIALWKLSSHTS